MHGRSSFGWFHVPVRDANLGAALDLHYQGGATYKKKTRMHSVIWHCYGR